MKRWPALLLALPFTACGRPSSGELDDAGRPDLSLELRTSADGHVVPTDATEMRAPPHQIRLLTWGGNWGLSQIETIVADGEKVKEGDVVVQFGFKHEDMVAWFKRLRGEAAAEAEKSAIENQRRLDELLVESRQREIAAARAAVDVERRRVVSAIQSKIDDLNFQLAQFERDASQRRIAAHRLSMEAEARYHERHLAHLDGAYAHYEVLKEHFVLKAPHPGIVRHAYHPWHRRKVQKGDGMRAGMEVVHIAKDESLSVEVFVPEHRMASVRPDLELAIHVPSTGERYRARVEKIARFPQEIGFLKKDDSLPNAREKAYSVRASFLDPPKDLLAGNEVKVEIP